MGTHLVTQKRGKGGSVYRTPKHRFISDAKYPLLTAARTRAQVIGFVQDPSKDTLLAQVMLESGKFVYLLAAEGLRTGDGIELGTEAKLALGSVVTLGNIPDSNAVFDLELKPNDGGKIARTSGASATIVSHDEDSGIVTVKLSSKQTIKLSPLCRATIGVASGGGRMEKPLMRAGSGKFKAKSRNKRWPKVRGSAMSAYDHPHGGRSMGKPTTVSRHAPAGQKVGHIAASRTGRRRGKIKEEQTDQ